MMDLGSGVGKYNLSQFKEPSFIAQGGATMRGAFTGLGDKIMGAIAEPGLKREQEANNAKVQQFLMAYNDKQNPSNPIFGGLEGSQRALKLARILLPIAPEMSARWEQEGMSMAREEKSSGMDLEKLKQKGLSDIEIERVKQSKPKEAKEIEASTPENLYRQVQGAIQAGKYAEFYKSLNQKDQLVLPTPGTETKENTQSLLKKDVGAGATLANEIAQSGYKTVMDKEGAKQAPLETMVKTLGAGEASIGLDQIKKEADGMFSGVPKTLESQVSNIKGEYLKSVAPPTAIVNEASKLIGILGDGNSPVTGTRAIASIFGLMKALDPTSTVRESEFDSVAGANGVAGKLTNLFGKLESGLTLSPDQVKEMISLANSWKKSAQSKIDDVRLQADALAKDLKIQSQFVTGQSPGISKSTFKLGRVVGAK